MDIDHMEDNRDFTYNKKEFAGLKEYMLKTQHEYGLKWIIILVSIVRVVRVVFARR